MAEQEGAILAVSTGHAELGSSSGLFLKRSHRFDNGTHVAVFGDEQDDHFWLTLNDAEIMMRAELDPETIEWLGKRTGVEIPPFETQPSLMIIDRDKQLQSRVIDESQNMISSQDSRIKLFEGLEGTLEDNLEGGRTKHRDTDEILDQKRQVREHLHTLVQAEVEGGRAAEITTLPDGRRTYMVLVNDIMAAASLIDGDVHSPNTTLRQQSSLLKAGQTLTVIENADGYSYVTPAWGKVQLRAPHLKAWKPNQEQTLTEMLSTSDLEAGVMRRVYEHLTQRMLRSPQTEVIYPQSYQAESQREFDFDAYLEDRQRGINPELLDFLMREWYPDTVAKRQASLADRDIRHSNLPEHVIEWLLTLPDDEQALYFARYTTITDDFAHAVDDHLRMAGNGYLGEAGYENLLRRMYIGSHSFIERHGLRWGDIVLQVQNSTGSLADASRAYVVDLDRRYPEDEALKTEHFIQFLTARRVSRKLREVGARNFNPEQLTHTPRIQNETIFARARELLRPADGLSLREIIARQVTRLSELGNGRPVYETPESKAVAEKLAGTEYADMAYIPWMSAEGHAEVEGREELEDFAAAISLSSAVVRSLYMNPSELARTCKLEPESAEYLEMMDFARRLQIILDWKMGKHIPKPSHEAPGLDVPLVLSRPDFARADDGEGGFVWKATELENSPGGLGMQEIITAGYPEAASDVAATFHQFMQEYKLPKGIDPEFNRNRLTIVMTEEWEPYRRELEIFLGVLRSEYGVETHIHSIEELSVQEQGTDMVEPGYVFHFAYPWNFHKNPEMYYVNLMLDPERLAHEMGLELKDVVRKEFLVDGEVNLDELQRALQGVMADGEYVFKRDMSIPTGFWETRLRREIYRDDILNRPSQKPEYAGAHLKDVGAALAHRMSETSKSLQVRQGKDIVMFNDPLMGRFVHTKMGMAAYHLPGFEGVFKTVLERFKFDPETAQRYGELLRKMTARTVPLISAEQNAEVGAYSQPEIDHAREHKDKWVIKISVDAQFGAFDWGSRGVFKGSEMDIHQWEAILSYALGSSSPFVLQEVVDNVPFDQPRKDRNGRTINLTSREQIGLFQASTEDTVFPLGSLKTARTRVRFNPFLMARFGDKPGTMVGRATTGIVTIRPYDNEDNVTSVHGSTDSAMVPVIYSKK